MKLIILATLLLDVFSTESAINEAERREGISYSTNVLHGDPNFPDQQAQSSIDFNLETSDVKSTLQPAHQGMVFAYTTPKSSLGYQHQDWYTTATFNPKKTSTQYRTPQVYTHQTNPTYAQSQSFNVGYSVKFGNERGKVYKAPRLEADIITGSRKEEVKKPQTALVSGSSNYNVFLEAKKQKITGIKPKYNKVSSVTPSSHQVIAQAHVTPKTQQHLAFLESVQGVNKFQKEIEQSLQSGLQSSAATSPWQSLSPSVEILRSQELRVQQPKYGSFDHQRALGKSEGFDYTNAVDYSGLQSSNQLQQYVHQPLHPASHQHNQPQILSFLSQGGNSPPKSAALVAESKQIPKLPMDTSLLRDPFLTIQKQPLTSDTKQIPIHFDTSLIQEIGKQYSNLYEESRSTAPTYPVQTTSFKIDVDSQKPSPTPEAMNQFNFQHFNNLLAEQSKIIPQQQYQQHQQHQQQQQQLQQQQQQQQLQQQQQQQQLLLKHHLVQQQQQSPSETSLVKSNDPLGLFLHKNNNKAQDFKFGFPQNGLFNPSVQKVPHKYHSKKLEYHRLHKPYMVKENVDEKVQPQQQVPFKVFGKPSNGFMRHEYEKRQKKNGAPRQPRISPKRTIRDYSIETDLKPPPMPFNVRPRRMHKH